MSSSGKRRKTDNNRRKKEAEKRTDEKEATKLNQRNFNKEFLKKYNKMKCDREKKQDQRLSPQRNSEFELFYEES